MHLGTQLGSKIMKTLKEMKGFKDLPLFATIAMRSRGSQDARSALRPALSRMLVNCLVSCANIDAQITDHRLQRLQTESYRLQIIDYRDYKLKATDYRPYIAESTE